jgi:hypothetical protein
VLGNTTPEYYFYHSTNKTFHDLTNGRSLPAPATSILGMGMKFIPTLSWTPTPTVIEESVNRFEQDISLKVFFAGDDNTGTMNEISEDQVHMASSSATPTN